MTEILNQEKTITLFNFIEFKLFIINQIQEDIIMKVMLYKISCIINKKKV